MKYLATYCLLLVWCGYFLFGQLAPIWASNSPVNKSSCHVQKSTEEKKDGCCAKMHKEQKETNGTTNEHKDKGDCGQKDCSLSCCHLSAVVLSTFENTIPTHLLPKQSFSGLENGLLPNPFLGVVCPPPNC